MLFTGTFEHAIDAKQRLAIPSEVRERLNPETDGQAFYVLLGRGLPNLTPAPGSLGNGADGQGGAKSSDPGLVLCLYTERDFAQRAEQLDHSELPPDDVLASELALFPLARRVELDKQGRVRLPESLLSMVELDKDVVLIGVKDHLEIHDRARWNAYLTHMLTQRRDLLRNPRQLMK